MLKKMMLLAMAVGALIAFVGPAVAQGATLTDEAGEHYSGPIAAVSTNLKWTTASSALACEEVSIHGSASQSGGMVTISSNVVTVTTFCPINGLPPTYKTHVTSASMGTITIGAGTGSTAATFTYDLTNNGVKVAGVCHLAGTIGFTYTSGTGVLNVPGSGLAGGGPGCTEGGTMHGSFTITDGEGNPLTID
jgi:hypothetical protein